MTCDSVGICSHDLPEMLLNLWANPAVAQQYKRPYMP